MTDWMSPTAFQIDAPSMEVLTIPEISMLSPPLHPLSIKEPEPLECDAAKLMQDLIEALQDSLYFLPPKSNIS